MVFDFDDKVALVTGGASGIGLAYVKELLLNGCRGVSILDVNAILGNEILEELKSQFGKNRIIFIHVDVSDKLELEGAFQTTVSFFKNLDIVINNAGLFDENDFERTININLIAVVRGTKLALQKFLPKYKSGEEGIVVNTSSIGALILFKSCPIYISTKLGVIMLGRSLESVYEKTKIRVLTICPGVTDTPMLPSLLRATEVDQKNLRETVDMDNLQPPEKVGKALITVINEGKSGSVWLADQKPVYEVEIGPIWKQTKQTTS